MTHSALTETEVKDLVVDWYKKLDVHVPMVELLPMLADEGLEMQFPEATVKGHVGFEGWYQRVIRIFFDEVHLVKKADVTIDYETANVDIIVQWEASVWDAMAAAPYSKRIELDAYQRWVVKRSPDTGNPIVVTYIVDKLDYHEGSATL